jgi:dihydroflavonol-4-reductase
LTLRVLVTGATGLIGCHATAALLREGSAVRAVVRDPAKLDAVMKPFDLASDALEVVTGDVTDAASIEAALAGCDAAIHCAGRFSHELSDADALQAVNVAGTDIVLTAAVRAGLDPVIHISSMLALLPPVGPSLTADDPVGTASAMYSRTKADADRLARRLQDDGAPVTIVYPGSVQGPDDPTLGSGPAIFAGYLETGRVLVTKGGLGYTDVRDLALLLTRLVRPGCGPRRIMAPTDFVEHERFYQLLCELTGRTLKADRVPAVALRLLGRLGDLRQRITGKPVQLTSEAALVLTRSVPFDDAEGRSLLGTPPPHAEPSVSDRLGWMFDTGVLEARHVGRISGSTTPRGV